MTWAQLGQEWKFVESNFCYLIQYAIYAPGIEICHWRRFYESLCRDLLWSGGMKTLYLISVGLACLQSRQLQLYACRYKKIISLMILKYLNTMRNEYAKTARRKRLRYKILSYKSCIKEYSSSWCRHVKIVRWFSNFSDQSRDLRTAHDYLVMTCNLSSSGLLKNSSHFVVHLLILAYTVVYTIRLHALHKSMALEGWK